MGLLDMFGRDAIREDEERKKPKTPVSPIVDVKNQKPTSGTSKREQLSEQAITHVHPSIEFQPNKVEFKVGESLILIERHEKGDVSVFEGSKEIAKYTKSEAKHFNSVKVGQNELRVRCKEAPNFPFINMFMGEGLDVYVNDKPVQGTLHDPYEITDDAKRALYLLGGVVLVRTLLGVMFLSDQMDGGMVVFYALIGAGLFGLGKYSKEKPLISMAVGGFLGLLMTADMIIGWMFQISESFAAGGSNPRIFTLLLWLSLLAAPTMAVFRGYFAARKIQKIEGSVVSPKESVKHEKVGFLFVGIAVTMLFIAISSGLNPLDEWSGLLLWGALIALCFVKLTRAKFIGGIVGTFVIFIIITAVQPVSDVNYVSPQTLRDAIENPLPSDGNYLSAEEFGIRISHYLPLDSDLSQGKKLELCLSIAEEKLADVTTPEQRKQGCSYYALVDIEDYQMAVVELVQYLDEQSPEGRLEYCKSKGPELFGSNVTQEEADVRCEWIAYEWEEARIELLNALSK